MLGPWLTQHGAGCLLPSVSAFCGMAAFVPSQFLYSELLET